MLQRARCFDPDFLYYMRCHYPHESVNYVKPTKFKLAIALMQEAIAKVSVNANPRIESKSVADFWSQVDLILTFNENPDHVKYAIHYQNFGSKQATISSLI